MSSRHPLLSQALAVAGAFVALVTFAFPMEGPTRFAGGFAVAAASVAGHTLYDLARERRSSERSGVLGDVSREDAPVIARLRNTLAHRAAPAAPPGPGR